VSHPEIKSLCGAFDEPRPFLISLDPTAADPELAQQRAESTKEEKQTQGREKDGEGQNEIRRSAAPPDRF
jgi:hypothetical protein